MVSLFPLLIKRLGERKVKGRERESLKRVVFVLYLISKSKLKFVF